MDNKQSNEVEAETTAPAHSLLQRAPFPCERNHVVVQMHVTGMLDLTTKVLQTSFRYYLIEFVGLIY